MSKACDKTETHRYCDEAVLNIEKSFWQKLNFVDGIRTYLHLMICKNCSDYKKESRILHRLLCGLKKKGKIEMLTAEDKQNFKNNLPV